MDNNNEKAFYLELNINEQRVLLALIHVEIVLPIVALQSVPDKNHLLKGVLNYHGKGVPVYDLAQLLDLDKTQTNINSPLLLVKIEGKQVGLFLNEVLDVIEIEQSSIQHLSLSNMKSYVSGIYETTEHNAWRLNLEALFKYHHLSEDRLHNESI